MTKREKMYQEIEKHGKNLNNIFHTSKDNVSLCKSLRRLETKAHRLTTAQCNGEIDNEYNYETDIKVILDKVNQLLGNIQRKHIPIFINGDPRGYALKIKDDYVRENNIKIYRDWGGYGILAPDFN